MADFMQLGLSGAVLPFCSVRFDLLSRLVVSVRYRMNWFMHVSPQSA